MRESKSVFLKRRFSEWRPVFDTTAVRVGFVVGDVISGQFSLRVRGFSTVSYILIYLPSEGWTLE